jgi:hypothetical protein
MLAAVLERPKAIVAESSYVTSEVVNDAYGGTSDPTVGLLQIRFSSTVHDFNYSGPPAKIAAIGCDWPAELPGETDSDTFWKAQGANAEPRVVLAQV